MSYGDQVLWVIESAVTLNIFGTEILTTVNRDDELLMVSHN
jgi:hypothetical protein